MTELESILAMDVHVEDDVEGRIELEAGHIPIEDYVGEIVKMKQMSLNKWRLSFWRGLEDVFRF